MDGSGFDPETFIERARAGGHNRFLGLAYVAHGDGWCELALPYAPHLAAREEGDVLASGPIVALLDVTASISVWQRRGRFGAQATVDLRVDYLRPAVPGRSVIGRAECYRLARSIAFSRGIAHDGDPDDPVASFACTYMILDGADARSRAMTPDGDS